MQYYHNVASANVDRCHCFTVSSTYSSHESIDNVVILEHALQLIDTICTHAQQSHLRLLDIAVTVTHGTPGPPHTHREQDVHKCTATSRLYNEMEKVFIFTS